MDKIISFVKILALSQFVLIILLLLAFFITRLILTSKDKKKISVRENISEMMDKALKNKTLFTASELTVLRKNIFELLVFLAEKEDKYGSMEFYPELDKQLSTELFKPMARRLVNSPKWFKRYVATQAYSHGFDVEDEKRLIDLTKDNSLLVSLNAAAIVLKDPKPEMVNAVIDIYSTRRRLQQSSCSDFIKKSTVDMSPMIVDRLEREQNIYVKMFCYRLLSHLGDQPTVADVTLRDLALDSADLKIAILYYVHRTHDSSKEEMILSMVQDTHWEVRATVAKLLGSYHSNKNSNILETLLHDSEWWVRVNAANALVNQGEDGVAILQNQKPDANANSFEIAQNVIKHLDKNSSVQPKE